MSKDGGKLWGGRFEEQISDISLKISESISFDIRLMDADIDTSIAHASMLGFQKILPADQAQKIIEGLEAIRKEFNEGKIKIQPELEDIHTHVEKRLTEIIGEDGKRLHTGRSRNDQVAADTHLFLKRVIEQQRIAMLGLLQKLIELSELHKDEIWTGYTHTQIAQPVSLGHYILSWFWKFRRDLNLLDFALSETSFSPLGAAALAGPNYPIDSGKTASDLGFTGIYQNSMDAVSSRDYQLSYHFFAVRFFLNISRLCEDLILYSTSEFGLIKMSDRVTTGSSIMPQKKNPDIAEILRGRSGRVAGNLTALMMNLKGLPMTYNRDLQEDKIYLFDTIDLVGDGIAGIIEIIGNIRFYPEKAERSLEAGFAQATDLADHLVAKFNLPFRQAHEITGQVVLHCEKKHITMSQLKQEDLNQLLPEGITVSPQILTLNYSLKNKQGTGSASPDSVRQQIKTARKILSEISK